MITDARIVPSGCMEISSNGRMKAYLGSCVGIAALDEARRIGGMLHVILPMPVSDIPESHVTSYAMTGIPVFLEELYARGASPETISTFVAGGALIDPESERDLEMNVGGRTLDMTLETLKRCNVPIRTLEASGTTGMCMVLDVDRGSCTIEPVLGETRACHTDGIHAPTPAEIGRTIESIKPVPQIAITIADMLSGEDADLPSIASEIKKDQVLSADVLRLCNSAYISAPRHIETIDEAVTILGTKSLMQLVITGHMKQFLECTDNGYSLMRGGIFFHSLSVARLCERLASGTRAVRPQAAYTAGLLHDIGKVVLDQFMARIQPLFYRNMQINGGDITALERGIFGIDHTLAGLQLAETWNLPASIKDVVLFHHSPDMAQDDLDLTHLVFLADMLCLRLLPGLVVENLDPLPIDKSMRLLGLAPSRVEESLSLLAEIY
jgi:putative nucleotidyltransferase with HDIG domain